MNRLPAFPRRDEREHGQILLLFALGLVVFIGFAALAVDIGSLYVARRDYQNVSDAAALAGAAYLTRPLADNCAGGTGGTTKQECARRAAWRYISDQLDLGLSDAVVDDSNHGGTNTPAAGQQEVPTPGSSPYTIWVSTPPSGSGSAAAMSTVADETQVLFVRIERQRDVFFGKIFAPQGFTVAAWSTAGIFPNRWAVITLRRGQGGVDIDPGDISAKDIKISGGSVLRVVDGDVGGNYGMRIDGSAGTHLYIDSSNPEDEANVYLIDNVSCGSSCWVPAQITDSAGNIKAVKHLPGFVADPLYPAPPIPGTLWPNGLVDNAPGTLDIPNGDTDTTPYSGPPPNISINTGTVSGATCVGPSGTSADAPRLGPGTYHDITVSASHCLILDPVWTYNNPGLGIPGGRSAVPATQFPGIYYLTGQMDVRNNALVVGDGVSLIIRPDGTLNQFSPNGVIDLNHGLGASAPTVEKLGAWTSKGETTYAQVGGSWVYQSSEEANPTQYGIGIAIYVLKPTQYSASASATDNTDVIKMTSTGAGLAWNGITYAARDNVTISGQPSHSGIGQLVSWTFTFTGSVPVTQTFDGPGDGFPYLIEPCVQIAGACQ